MVENQTHQYVLLQLKQETYALPIHEVHEVIKYTTITILPTDNPTLLGVINLRGSIVPIISLAKKLGTSESSISKHSRIIIVANENEDKLGLVVDSVKSVSTFEKIEQPLDHMESLSFIEGIGQIGNLLVTILNSKELVKI